MAKASTGMVGAFAMSRAPGRAPALGFGLAGGVFLLDHQVMDTMAPVYLADCDGLLVLCVRRADAEAIAAGWNADHADAIADLDAPDFPAEVSVIERWAGLGPVWERLPAYRAVWSGWVSYSPAGEVSGWGPVSCRWSWEFETDEYTEAPARSRVVPVEDGAVYAQVLGLDEAAVREVFVAARAEALRSCGAAARSGDGES